MISIKKHRESFDMTMGEGSNRNLGKGTKLEWYKSLKITKYTYYYFDEL